MKAKARAALLKSRQKAGRELLKKLRELDGSDLETLDQGVGRGKCP